MRDARGRNGPAGAPDGTRGDAFRDRSVIVTGASSGLGARLAVAFAEAGARPVLFARSAERLADVAAACRDAGAEPLVVTGDVSDPAACRALVERTVEETGRLDLLVACAGLSMWAPFDRVENPSLFRRLMEVNYLGVVYPALYALPHLERSRGMLVAISSVQGVIGVPYHTGYAAAKHAVQGFCDSLRLELRGSGVDVLTVLPHWIRGTRLRERALDAGGRPAGGPPPRSSAGRPSPEEVARAVLAAIGRRARILYLPGRLRLLPCLRTAVPGLVDRVVSRTVEREGAERGAGRPRGADR